MTLKSKLVEFLDEIPFDTIAKKIAAESDKSTNDISKLLNIYANESQVTLDLITEHLEGAERILEAGAGLCLLSLFLKQEGFPIIALEPALGGYGIFKQARNAILDHFSELNLQVLTKPAQQLNTPEHGTFDLIFSNNVMEHIPDWECALTAMASVLAPEGKMRHSCPNYTIPYEPHYSTLAFHHFRRLSKWLFLPKGVDTEIWDSLNFITYRAVKKICKEQKLSVSFEKGLLYRAFQRIHGDPLFKVRHEGIVVYVANIVMKPPLKWLVRNVPTALSTPMIFEIMHLPQKEED